MTFADQPPHPSDCTLAIDRIYDPGATFSHPISHVGLGWTTAPSVSVRRPEFLSAPEGHLQLVDRRSFPATCIHRTAGALVTDRPLAGPGRLAWIDHQVVARVSGLPRFPAHR